MNKKIILIITILIIITVTYRFLTQPFRIQRSGIGPYKEGQIVLSVSRKILFNRPLVAGDIVVFKIPERFGDNGIGTVMGGPGDSGRDVKYFSGEAIGETVPNGFYIIEYSGFLKAVSESQITYVVWFPVRWSQGMNARNPDL